MHGQGADKILDVGVEPIVQGAVSVKACNVVARRRADLGKDAAYDDFSVGLQRHVLHDVVRAIDIVETRIGAAIRGVQTDDVIAPPPVDLSKLAA